MLRKPVVVVAALALLVMLAGCTGIPYAGRVNKGVPAVTDVTSDIQYLPAGPSDGASPEQILRGFVEAGTSPVGDWKIARQYLTTSFARSWDPRAAVIIDGGTRRVDGTSDSGFTIDTDVQAHVDAEGNYTTSRDITPTSFRFGFTQENGQWRISSGPNGIIMDAAAFPRVFSATPLFFYLSGTSTLVPDMRWFPARVSTSTRVIKALIQGPSTWLSATGGVTTAIPQGADLVADSVPVESGVASVNLDSRTIKITNSLSDLILRQIASSLVGVPEISAVNLYFSGNLQGQKPVPSLQTLVSPKRNSPTFVMTDGLFGYFEGGKISPLLGDLSEQVSRLNPSAVTIGIDRSFAAANSTQGVFALQANRLKSLIDNRSDLLPASIDANGFVWTVPANDPTKVRITSSTGLNRTISLPWAKGAKISVLTLSTDGTRLVAGIVSGSKNIVCAATIGRGSDHWPSRIGSCRSLVAPLGTMISASWLDSMRVAILSDSRAPNLRVLTVGGTYSDLTPPLGSSQVYGSGSDGYARVLTGFGELFEQSSTSRWKSLGSKITLVGSTQ
ncbi:MAG: hypothetical protein RLZZ600_457 [Actinomycetota bacterium]|jgi:hypothetical protein